MDNTILAQKKDFVPTKIRFNQSGDFLTRKKLDGPYEVRFFSKKLSLGDNYAVPLISGVKRIYCTLETEWQKKEEIIKLINEEYPHELLMPEHFNWYFEKL